MKTCECCGNPIPMRNPDPWDERMNEYCEECAWNRCDAFPGTCPNRKTRKRLLVAV